MTDVFNKFTVAILSRDFLPVVQPRFQLTPLRCSWRAMGGPSRATLAIAGDPPGLACFVGLLGRSVVIHDPQGTPYWWGYLHGFEVREEGLAYRLSLDALANRLAVLYTHTDGVTPVLTGWAEDAGSQALYGVRERILKLETLDAAGACTWRDVELVARAHPDWQVGQATAKEAPAVLDCRGWYETLGWRYYTCEGVDPLETTAQMAAIMAACGQFLGGTRIENPSGIFTSPWRDGMQTALAELEMLAGLGTGGLRPYRLRIDNNRQLVVAEKPLPGSADWSLGSDGCYRDQYGVRQPRWVTPVGQWVRPAGWAHAPAQPLGGGEGAGYVEEWEYAFM